MEREYDLTRQVEELEGRYDEAIALFGGAARRAKAPPSEQSGHH
jgi:hypothetical protein